MADVSEPLIIPEQLRAARETLALSLDEVADRLKISPAELARWESGVTAPSVERLWELGKLYQRSTDYFVKRTPPLLEPSFRVAQRSTITQLSLEARQVIALFEELCRAQSGLEALLGRAAEAKVKRVAKQLSPEDLARREREGLGPDDKPIPDLRGMLTGQGIRVFQLPIPNNEFAGLCWWHSDYGPCVLINARDDAGRRTFTLAHEYAHLLRPYASAMVCDLIFDAAEERFANRFAAVFLMPEQDLRRQFQKWIRPAGTLPTDAQIGRLRARYRVSLSALGIRLEELGLLPKGTMDQRKEQWGRGSPLGKSRPRWRRKLGEAFVSLAFEAYAEGHISLGKLARYLGIDAKKALEAVRHSQGYGGTKGNG